MPGWRLGRRGRWRGPASPPRHFGEVEKALPPPRGLLRWLVEHAGGSSANAPALGEGSTGDLRRRLLARDPDAIRDALRFLDERATRRA
jgi:hypothetical protein